MTEEHHIQWIELLTPTYVQRHEMKSGEIYEAEFMVYVIKGEKISTREYSNPYELWGN